jgi:hypothetical protein
MGGIGTTPVELPPLRLPKTLAEPPKPKKQWKKKDPAKHREAQKRYEAKLKAKRDERA